LPKDTIVITSRGTVGKICMLPFPMSFNQTCYGLVTKKGAYPLYLFYKLKSMLSQIDSLSYGTVFDTITKKTFDELKFCLPSENEQRAIASILCSLDDKIALNRSMNFTLEAIGQALFRRWFVDFEFPDEEGKPYSRATGRW
jgi:type I restriction enzyme S subunit